MVQLGATVDLAAQTIKDYELLMSEVVSVDADIANVAFVIGSETPQRLPLTDALISAAAKVRGCVLIHRDNHMATIPVGLLAQRQLQVVAE